MEDEPRTAETAALPENQGKPEEARPRDHLVRMAALAGVSLILLALVAFAGKVQNANTRAAGLQQTASAVAAAVLDPILQHDRNKLSVLVQRVAKDGGFEKVTLTDETGAVMASTDTTRLGQIVEALKAPPKDSQVREDAGDLVVRRGIFLGGDTAVGGIELVSKP